MKYLALLLAVTACQKIDPLYCADHPTERACGGSGSAGDSVSIGGTVTGLGSSHGLVLQNNGTDDLPIAMDGNFVFATPIAVDDTYNVTVSVQPTQPSLMCAVTKGTGTASVDVNNVVVTCMPAAYSIGGVVVGLASGSQVVLANGSDQVTVSSSTTFQFPTKVPSGSSYSVTIVPPAGSCAVFGGGGVVGNADVSSIVVNCSSNEFAIGGNVTGLNGTVVLGNSKNNDSVSISSNGTYAFPMLVGNGMQYNVSVTAQPSYPPASQACSVANASGNALMNVQDINVSCMTNHFTVGGNVTGLTGTLVLQDNGGDNLTITSNGGFTFATPVDSGTSYTVTVAQQPTNQTCTINRAMGVVGNGPVNNVGVSCAINDQGIRCGNGYCDPATQECCSPTSGASCQPKGTCGGALICDDAYDCTAQGMSGYCCELTNGGNNQYRDSTCTNSCSHILCDPNVNGSCPSGTCKPDNLLPNVYSCQ